MLKFLFEKPKVEEVSNQLKQQIVFVIDVSGSMNDEGWTAEHSPNSVTKLDCAKDALRLFVSERRKIRPNDVVSIVTYSTRAKIILSHINVSEENCILKHIQYLQPDDYTNMEEGLQFAYEVLKRLYAWNKIPRRIILLTDGYTNVGGDGTVVADEIKSCNTIIDTIGIGKATSCVDESLLKRIASLDENNNPRYRFISQASDLLDLFKGFALEPVLLD